MYVLHHYFLCPSSRFIRICLDEKKIKFRLQIENYWNPQTNFLLMNPGAFFPVLLKEDNKQIVGSNVIVEFLEEIRSTQSLFDEKKRYEIRRIVNWFEFIFKRDVIEPILYEKIFKRFEEKKNPDSKNIRKALENLKFNLSYFEHLIGDYDYIVGDKITYADLFFASSISVLDYMDELNFRNFNKSKDLYLKIKSRPSFKSVLKDRIVGVSPNKKYMEFDY